MLLASLFSYAPKGYKWLVNERLNAMYRRLRRIEARLQHDVTAADVSALEADLDGVDRAIHSLAVPMRYSDVYFSVKSHLDSRSLANRIAPRRGGCAYVSPRPRAWTYRRATGVCRGFRKI